MSIVPTVDGNVGTRLGWIDSPTDTEGWKAHTFPSSLSFCVLGFNPPLPLAQLPKAWRAPLPLNFKYIPFLRYPRWQCWFTKTQFHHTVMKEWNVQSATRSGDISVPSQGLHNRRGHHNGTCLRVEKAFPIQLASQFNLALDKIRVYAIGKIYSLFNVNIN